MKHLFTLIVFVSFLFAESDTKIIKFNNINPFKFTIDSSFEDKFTNFNDTLFVIPSNINVKNKFATLGYYVILDEPVDINKIAIYGKVTNVDKPLFMSLKKLSVYDNTKEYKIKNIKEYRVQIKDTKNNYFIHHIMGIEKNQFVSFDIMLSNYLVPEPKDYDICKKKDIEVKQVLGNNKYIFKTCKRYGKSKPK